ncbi:recombinase family protein [Arthrobacter sp. A5]|uniref:recombinase family protein n=1 Tax=Arthrobacter sp. A5 TaxID=576926 RepID=UPI003DA9A72B
MTGLLIGYARIHQRPKPHRSEKRPGHSWGDAKKTFTDQGLTATNRARPGLREALPACRAGDTPVVTKLDRPARPLRDAKDIVDELTGREVKLSIAGSLHDPTDPVGRLLFNVLAVVAEFEADLIRARTRDGMAVAKAKVRLRGKQPKLSQKHSKRTWSPFTEQGRTRRWNFPNSSL